MYCRENQKLGELDLPVPAAPAGKEGADVRFTWCSSDGPLEVEATSLTTGRTISTVLVGQGSGLTEEQARRRLKELEGLKIHPRDQQENRLLLAKGERLWQEALGEEHQIPGQAVQLFGEALASQENGRILQAVPASRTCWTGWRPDSRWKGSIFPALTIRTMNRTRMRTKRYEHLGGFGHCTHHRSGSHPTRLCAENTHLPPGGGSAEDFDFLHKAFTAAMRAARQGVNLAVMEPESAPVPAAPAAAKADSAEARHAAAKAAGAARRAAEQQAVGGGVSSRAQRPAGGVIQLGQGEQEEGQQFDFRRQWTPPRRGLPEQKTEPGRCRLPMRSWPGATARPPRRSRRSRKTGNRSESRSRQPKPEGKSVRQAVAATRPKMDGGLPRCF